MAEKATIILEALMNVSQVESSISRIQKGLKELNIPKDISDNLVDGFSKLGPLLKDYKKQLNSGFSTQKDVNNLKNLGQKIDEVFSDIDSNIKKVNSEEIRLNVDLTNIKNARSEVTKVTTELDKIINSTFNKIGDGLKKKNPNFSLDFLKGVYVSNDVKKVGKELTEAFNTRDIDRYRAAYEKLRQVLNSTSNTSKTKQNIAQQMGLGPDAINDVDKVKSKVDELLKILRISDTTSSTFDKTKASLEQADSALTKLLQDAQTNGSQAFQGTQDSISGIQTSMQQLTAETGAYGQSVADATSQIKSLQQSTQYFFSLRNMINLFKRGIREAVDTVKDLDKVMTETAVVTKYSVEDMWGKLPEYTANANALGATVQDMYESTTLYYQQGLNTQQAMEIATETMKMARIAGLEAKDATDMMTAALRGFNMEINETSAQHINDVYSNLAAKTASNTKELGTAMQRTASIAHSAGMSFEGTAAFLAQAIETTREPAENLGTAMKTIVARFTELKKNPLEIAEVDGEEVEYNKVDAALKSIGVSLKDANGQFRDLDKVFLDISAKWDNLSQTQQRYVATTAAGSRQQSRFIAMMSNYERTMQLMGYANDSAGASTAQFNKTLESLEAKINKFQNAWKQFLMGIMNDKWTKRIVDAGTGVLNIVNKIIDTLSFNGKAGLLKSILSTFTAFTALKTAGRGVNALIGGLGGAVDPKSNFKAGVQTGMIGRNSAQAINQPIVKELQSIKSLLAQKINQSNLGRNTTVGPYDEWNRFKAARAEIETKSATGNVNDLVKQLSGLSAQNQNMLMRGYSATFQAASSAIIGGYTGKYTKEIRKGANFLNNQRKSAQITAEEYYTALRDPGLLKQAMLKAGVQQDNPAYTYMDNLDKVATETAGQLLARAQGKFEGAVAKARAEGKTINEQAYQRSSAYYKSDKAQAYFKNKALQQYEGYNPKYNVSKIGLAVQKIGEFGSGISQAGMGIQAFGSILTSSANPALQMFGSALTTIGGLLSGLGMGISALSSGFTTLAGSQIMESAASALLTTVKGAEAASGAAVAATANILTGGLLLLVGAIAGTVLWIKKHNEKIKEAAEEVQTKYQEKNDKAQTNINNLQSWKEDFARLVGGVDSNGLNVNLSTEDYDRYLEITRGIAEINPSIVEGYNAQGQAIITNNKALEETLALEKQRQTEAFEEYTAPKSLEKLLKARDLSKIAKTEQKETTESSYGATIHRTIEVGTGKAEFKPQKQMRKQAQKIGELLTEGIKDGWAQEDLLEDFNINLAKLAEGDEETLSKFDALAPKIQQRISDSMDAAGDELKDSAKNNMLDALSGYSEASEELDELITPTYEYLLATTSEYASAIPTEFKKYFNEGLKNIAADANISDPVEAAHALADGFGILTKKGSDYHELLQDIDDAQNEYAKTLDKDTYDKFAEGAVERLNKIRNELGEQIDLTQGYGKAIDEFITNEIDKVQRFTEAGATSLKHALNTMVDQIAAAEGALENFNKIAEGTYYGKAASNISQIYESATADEHIAGEGDQVFWAGAQAIVGRKNLLENGTATKDSALKQMKAVQEMLKGGQEGWDNFKIRWFDSVEAMGGKLVDANGEIIQGIQYHDNGWIKSIDENLNPEVYEQIADALNMSKDSLIAMFNVGRQFGEIDFTNIADIRKALATSDNTIKNAENRKVFVKQDFLESEMTSAGVDLNKQQQIEEDLQKNYNTEFIQSVEEIAKDSSQLTRMGIKDMESLVKTFDETGQFTKDEIAAYAEAYEKSQGKEFDATEFNKIWEQNKTDEEYGGIPGSLDTIESILSAIESILANQRLSEGYLDNATAADAKKWLFGGEGEDTDAQHFWKGHGSGENGEITASEFNKTSKDVTDFMDKSTD